MVRLLLLLYLLISMLPSLARDTTEVWLLVPDQKHQLRQAIAHYEELRTQTWHTFPANMLLKPGDSSRFAQHLAENLLLTGDLAPVDARLNTPHYHRSVAAAVARFQARHALKADSIVGPRTVAALNLPPEQRLQQLRNSLLRWEAFSRDLPQPYIIINIPDYTLQLIDQNSVRLHMRTIVGKPDLPTHVNHTNLKMLVINPYWYIPRSIATKEILPILKRNPGYLAKRDMELFKPTALGGWQKISPWEVNWKTVSAENFNYRIVQVTGQHNELGQMKFLFDTRVNQYLHDTKDKHLFAMEKRAYSHGCIRLQNPEDLALYLLQERSGFSQERTGKLMASEKDEQYVRVRKPVPLIIVYMTAWVDPLLGLQFREDVYGYDKLQEVSLGR